MFVDEKLKLFVVGEFSDDPDDWSRWNPYRAIVIAHDEKEASKLACGCNIVTEIKPTRPVKLMSESEPDDL